MATWTHLFDMEISAIISVTLQTLSLESDPNSIGVLSFHTHYPKGW